MFSYGLYHHLDDLTASLTAFIIVGGASVANPAFLPWKKQDQFLLGWFRSSITGTMLAQYITCQTARDLWQALHRVYSAVSKAKVMELRCMLQTTTRGCSSGNDFFEKMQGIADQLTATGSPVTESDLVSHILAGLGSDYNLFVVALTTRSPWFSPCI